MRAELTMEGEGDRGERDDDDLLPPVPPEPPGRKAVEEYRAGVEDDAEAGRKGDRVDARLHAGGDDHRPEKIRISLDAFASVINEAEAVDEIPGVAKGDEAVVVDVPERDGVLDAGKQGCAEEDEEERPLPAGGQGIHHMRRNIAHFARKINAPFENQPHFLL